MSAKPINQWCVTEEAELRRPAEELAGYLQPGVFIGLKGDLGAGKTTFVRHVLPVLGYDGRVKSPTYGLVETYALTTGPLHHWDLYRITEPRSLYDIGIEDYFNDESACLIEWPDRGRPVLPHLHFTLVFEMVDAVTRQLTLYPSSNQSLIDGTHEANGLSGELE